MPFVPRHMRTRYANRSGTVDQTKALAFRRAAGVSKKFINQSASALESPALANQYADYCDRTRNGQGLRKG